MTEDEFWRGVGESLRAERVRQGLTPSAMVSKGGPTNKTVDDIEEGQIGRLASLKEYIDALRLNLVDVFTAVLKTEREDQSPELQLVIRAFKFGGVTARSAMVSIANLAAEQQAPPSIESLGDPSALTKEMSRAKNGAAKRRVKR